ncbi:MarR family transcriptional regulator [Pontibacter diazotrophicus]|uniref:MarR family transcriptional regulator n=1 Tax=Pontibacter diazotrophicus TaxID=1400979 RepID=A0A3D8LFW3_9BACT|nr:MarR family transcriptional regulator [Pontibacter diazotrophicus]RDV16339.1 MarR family transcriptional regulator [Pontibacter diazotrophicus]
MILENEIGISAFRNEWQKASVSILYTYGFLSNGYESFFKQHGLTTQQYNALRILRDQFPKPVSTSFLREKMLDKMSDASRLVSRLGAKGLVEVTQNTADKRLVNIVISEEGQKVIGTIDKDLHQLDAVMQGLTEEEAKTLVELLYKVRESLKTADERIAAKEQVDADA